MSLRWLVLYFVALLLASGQTRPQDTKDTRPERIAAIAAQAFAAPPELGADILLRLAESSLGRDPVWQKDLLEQAFSLAPGAKYPFPLTGAIGMGIGTDSRVGVVMSALRQKLDTLSLRCRVVRAMLRLDKKRARELFQQIAVTPTPTLTCRDPMRPSVGEYYRVLQEIVTQGFDTKERKEGKHLELAESFVRSMSSAIQLEPVIELIQALAVTGEDLGRLVSAYGQGMRQIDSDDRTFSSSARYGLQQRIVELAKTCQKQEVSSYPLLDAWRAFLVRHLQGKRCSDSVDPQTTGLVQSRIVDYFNRDLRKAVYPAGTAIPPISEEETQPAKVEGTALNPHFWSKPETKKLLAGIGRLTYGNLEQGAGGRTPPLTVKERRDTAWEVALRDFLKEMDLWQRDHQETDSGFFHHMCLLYSPLIGLTPPGALRDQLVAAYVAFLKQSPMQKEDPPAWSMHLVRLIRLRDADAAQRARIREELRRSGDATMANYAELDEVLEAAPAPAGR